MRDDRWAGACFVLGPHRSGTTILTRCLAASDAFVYLSAADIVAFHRGADQVKPTLGRLVERKETRGIDRTELSEDLPEEYGFLLSAPAVGETAPLIASVHEDLAAKRGADAGSSSGIPGTSGARPSSIGCFPERSSSSRSGIPSTRSIPRSRPRAPCTARPPSIMRSSPRATAVRPSGRGASPCTGGRSRGALSSTGC